MDYLLGAAGMVLLLFGGESLVRGAVALAGRLGVSPLLIGLTLVAFGTSMPELVTSLQAALAGAPGIALGNVVGSNIANILLILGLSAVLAPVIADPAAFRRDGAVLVAVTLFCAAMLLSGALDRVTGGLAVAALLAWVVLTYRLERRSGGPSAELHAAGADIVPAPSAVVPVWAAVALVLAGLAATVLGARLLVDAAVALARALEVSETMIGLTIVAVGTSLPELVTSTIAALRGRSDLALGNVIGSNIFNVLAILGVTALVVPVPVPAEILRLDLWVMLGATAAMVLFAVTGGRISRIEGAAMMAGYAVYLGVLVMG